MDRKRLEARGSGLEAGHGWQWPAASDPDPCAHAGDVLDAARTGRWPDRIDDELKAHVADCVACRELAIVAPLLCEAWDETLEEAQPPSATLIWWRARRRAREEALRAAAWPVRAAQAVAAVIVVAGAIVLGWWVFDPLTRSLAALHAAAPAPGVVMHPDGAPLVRGAAVLGLLAAVVVVPVALFYVAMADE